MEDLKSPRSQNSGETRVDLGEDLLEGDPFGKKPRKPLEAAELTSDSAQSVDWFQNVKILLAEGLTADAKKIIHKVLIHQPEEGTARKILAEIQDIELKEIIERDSVRRPSWGEKINVLESIDPAALIQKLDEDLGLGITSIAGDSVSESRAPFYLSDPALLEVVYSSLENQLHHAKVQDWIDLGIAFLEMDLGEIAIRLFTGASKRVELDSPLAQEIAISTTCLIAFALIQMRKGFEAFVQLQPLLRDLDIRHEDKIELFYLVGRAYESMNKEELSQKFYFRVWKIDPKYRDIEYRFRKKLKKGI